MEKKAYAKINIFLKVVGTRKEYHEILSRFILYKELYDTVRFIPKKENLYFELIGDFNCSIKNNTITKIYNLLSKSQYGEKIKDFFSHHSVHVEKNIPQCAGLGGGSSNAASFLLLCNEVLDLKLTLHELNDLGLQVGADIPFFLAGYESANVGGIGERVEEFKEQLPQIELITPDVQCATKKVYEHYRKNFYEQKDKKYILGFEKCTSKVLLDTYRPMYLNDLYKSVMMLYPQMKEFIDDRWFMSGSGSSMFRIKNG